MELDGQGMQILDQDSCIALLGSVRIGRIALTHRALPIILPLAFRMVGTDLLCQVGDGVVARAAEANQVVGFEADSIDDDLLAGWSVSIVGRLTVAVTKPMRSEALRLDLKPWSSSPATLVRLVPEIISGRMRSLPD